MNIENKIILEKVLYLHVKEMQKNYLSLKNDKFNIYLNLEEISHNFKTCQKILEYVRKNHNYKIEKIHYDLIYTNMTIVYKISTKGRNTWTKNDNTTFEIYIDEDKIKLYLNKIEREMKLKRILKK